MIEVLIMKPMKLIGLILTANFLADKEDISPLPLRVTIKFLKEIDQKLIQGGKKRASPSARFNKVLLDLSRTRSPPISIVVVSTRIDAYARVKVTRARMTSTKIVLTRGRVRNTRGGKELLRDRLVRELVGRVEGCIFRRLGGNVARERVIRESPPQAEDYPR